MDSAIGAVFRIDSFPDVYFAIVGPAEAVVGGHHPEGREVANVLGGLDARLCPAPLEVELALRLDAAREHFGGVGRGVGVGDSEAMQCAVGAVDDKRRVGAPAVPGSPLAFRALPPFAGRLACAVELIAEHQHAGRLVGVVALPFAGNKYGVSNVFAGNRYFCNVDPRKDFLFPLIFAAAHKQPFGAMPTSLRGGIESEVAPLVSAIGHGTAFCAAPNVAVAGVDTEGNLLGESLFEFGEAGGAVGLYVFILGDDPCRAIVGGVPNADGIGQLRRGAKVVEVTGIGAEGEAFAVFGKLHGNGLGLHLCRGRRGVVGGMAHGKELLCPYVVNVPFAPEVYYHPTAGRVGEVNGQRIGVFRNAAVGIGHACRPHEVGVGFCIINGVGGEIRIVDRICLVVGEFFKGRNLRRHRKSRRKQDKEKD